MTRTKAGKLRRNKAFFEGVCSFVPGFGEVVVTWCEIGQEYNLFTEEERMRHSRLTADQAGFTTAES